MRFRNFLWSVYMCSEYGWLTAIRVMWDKFSSHVSVNFMGQKALG